MLNCKCYLLTLPKFDKPSTRPEVFSDPGGAGTNAEVGAFVEPAHPGRGESGEVHAVFVVSVEAIVIEVQRDDVCQRKFLDICKRMARAVEDERDGGKGAASAGGNFGVGMPPFDFDVVAGVFELELLIELDDADGVDGGILRPKEGSRTQVIVS